ncbi:hypothetical protein [Desulfosporosinus sp. SB140]|uniref:hypothetical protein n=1 Tax=Desulfosporosinus paludis TaxID=3115649 RepID=UPI00388E9F37
MDDYRIENFCQNFCDKLCNHLTVIKGYLDLSEEKDDKNFSYELRKEIDNTVKSIKECIDEINSWKW